MNAIPIRTVAAIDAEIAELELAFAGNAAADDDVATRIDSDEYDAGVVKLANMPREGRSGRFAERTSTLNAATYITAARARRAEYRAERVEMRRRVADLRAERRLWTDRTPLGMLEIESMLGYAVGTSRQWKRRAILPPCDGTVSGTPYWWRSTVLAWALARGRTRCIVELEIEDEPEYAEATW